ncbi:MAG: hypothetical protein FWD31_00875 [Planctomycetaceae bacterium]|nr:hypothetical protein [Planctomycetaceae bacterium]
MIGVGLFATGLVTGATFVDTAFVDTAFVDTAFVDTAFAGETRFLTVAVRATVVFFAVVFAAVVLTTFLSILPIWLILLTLAEQLNLRAAFGSSVVFTLLRPTLPQAAVFFVGDVAVRHFKAADLPAFFFDSLFDFCLIFAMSSPSNDSCFCIHTKVA